ncbi:hypothetical protein GOODEAATRI_010830 [Goodea atripinnis]|uniref:Uncharacterized protein n=1 Tax=Goodea atripinnis TaxID=208336 RepID=A0ABV0PMH3_9TELE
MPGVLVHCFWCVSRAVSQRHQWAWHTYYSIFSGAVCKWKTFKRDITSGFCTNSTKGSDSTMVRAIVKNPVAPSQPLQASVRVLNIQTSKACLDGLPEETRFSLKSKWQQHLLHLNESEDV